MSGTFVTNAPLVIGAPGAPQVRSGADDPTGGAGVVAPLGSLYMRTNGSVYWKSGAGDTAWTSIGSGGGGGDQINDLWGPRITPHAADDEFTGPALDASWVQTGFTALDFGTRPNPYVNSTAHYASFENRRDPDNSAQTSWLRVQPSTGTPLGSGIWKPLDSAAFGGAVPTDLLVWARMNFAARNATAMAGGDYTVGLTMFLESGSGFELARHATIALNDTQITQSVKARFWGNDGGVTTVQDSQAQDDAVTHEMLPGFDGYVALQKIDLTFHAWVIEPGRRIYMGALVLPEEPNALALWWSNTNTGSPGTMIYDNDFVRFYEGADWIP